MSMFRREKRSINGFQDLWGQGFTRDQIVGCSEDHALRLAPVFAATRIIADGIAPLPLTAHREQEEVRTPADLPPFLEKPGRYGTRVSWLNQLVVSMVLRGGGFGLITRYQDSQPAEIEWLHPDRVKLGGSDDVLWWEGKPLLWFVDGIPTHDIIHVPNFLMPGRILGISPIRYFAETTELGLQVQKFGLDWFRHGSIPAGILQTDQKVPQEDARTIKSRYKEAVAGRDVVVLGQNLKYQQVSVSPNESQFIETHRLTATQIASIFGVPPEDIGGSTGETMTYTNAEEKANRFLAFTIRPYLVKIETALSEKTNDLKLRFDTDELIRTDILARYQAYASALQQGWQSKDEIRAREKMAPIPDGEGKSFEPPAPDPLAIPAPVDPLSKPNDIARPGVQSNANPKPRK